MRGASTDPKLWRVGSLLSLLPNSTAEVKKADLSEGHTFLVGVKDRGQGAPQGVLNLVFSQDLGEKFFRDSRRMRSQAQPDSSPKEMFTDRSHSQTCLDSCLRLL